MICGLTPQFVANSFVDPAFLRGSLDWNRSLSTPQLRLLIKDAIRKIGSNSKKFANHSLRVGGTIDLL